MGCSHPCAAAVDEVALQADLGAQMVGGHRDADATDHKDHGRTVDPTGLVCGGPSVGGGNSVADEVGESGAA